jgi:Domain of unknown function (DUF1707)
MDEDVRVGDVEREAAISALEEHCRAGRLGMDELLERSAAAYAARTRAELAALTGDLPGRAGEAEQPRRKDAQAATPSRTQAALAAVEAGLHRDPDPTTLTRPPTLPSAPSTR